MGTHHLSRRKFVKGSALATGTIMAGLPVGASAFVGGASTLKLALVGCGGRGTGAANQALRADPDAELVAMADAFPDKVEGSYRT